jgi:hypothetical protein
VDSLSNSSISSMKNTFQADLNRDIDSDFGARRAYQRQRAQFMMKKSPFINAINRSNKLLQCRYFSFCFIWTIQNCTVIYF